MDEQLKQSIGYDITQLEAELTRIENEIRQKEDELKFISSKTKGVGTAAGALSFGLGALTLMGTKNPKIAKEAFSLGAVKGGEFGYESAEKGLQTLETDIALLKKERDFLLRRLAIANEKLKNLK